MAFIQVTFVWSGIAEWIARVDRIRWTLAIGDWALLRSGGCVVIILWFLNYIDTSSCGFIWASFQNWFWPFLLLCSWAVASHSWVRWPDLCQLMCICKVRFIDLWTSPFEGVPTPEAVRRVCPESQKSKERITCFNFWCCLRTTGKPQLRGRMICIEHTWISPGPLSWRLVWQAHCQSRIWLFEVFMQRIFRASKGKGCQGRVVWNALYKVSDSMAFLHESVKEARCDIVYAGANSSNRSTMLWVFVCISPLVMISGLMCRFHCSWRGGGTSKSMKQTSRMSIVAVIAGAVLVAVSAAAQSPRSGIKFVQVWQDPQGACGHSPI